MWLDFQMVQDRRSHESDALSVDTICGQLQILTALGRFKKIRFPKRTVVPRPCMTTEWEVVLIDLKALSGDDFKCETQSCLERRHLEMRVIMNGSVRPEMVLVLGSVLMQGPKLNFTLNTVEAMNVFEPLFEASDAGPVPRLTQGNALPVVLGINPIFVR